MPLPFGFSVKARGVYRDSQIPGRSLVQRDMSLPECLPDGRTRFARALIRAGLPASAGMPARPGRFTRRPSVTSAEERRRFESGSTVRPVRPPARELHSGVPAGNLARIEGIRLWDS